jgi:WD40 repeat protein
LHPEVGNHPPNFFHLPPSDGTIKLWSQLQNECLATLTGHQGWVNLIQLDGEGKLISGSYDRSVKLWDLNKQAKLHTLRGHKGSISCLKVKDKNTIVSGAYDGVLHLWDFRKVMPRALLGIEICREIIRNLR